MTLRLITIPISHYCERARWALEFSELEFVEERHLQFFHMRAVKQLGGKRTTPLLVTGDGVLTDSADIVAYADANGAHRLYPESDEERAEIETLERDIAGRFGIETRRLAYFNLLVPPRGKIDKPLVLKYNNQGAPRYQSLGLRLGFRPAMAFLCRGLKIDRAHVDRGRPAIDSMFETIADRLSDDRRYLFGDRFTAADLTFASLAAAIVAPSEYGVALPELDEVSGDARESIEHFRSLPAGQFALRLYRDMRNRSAA